jgi:hypothetical protein
MADAGVPLSVVPGLLGHYYIKTTMRYVHVHVVDDDIRPAVRAPEKGGRNNAMVESWSNGNQKPARLTLAGCKLLKQSSGEWT